VRAAALITTLFADVWISQKAGSGMEAADCISAILEAIKCGYRHMYVFVALWFATVTEHEGIRLELFLLQRYRKILLK
jgi:hypothetical protein